MWKTLRFLFASIWHVAGGARRQQCSDDRHAQCTRTTGNDYLPTL